VKYIDEFRDGELARGLAAAIRRAARDERDYRFMEFCGGHTHAIARYGVSDLLPAGVRMIHGPGCPVCVLPVGRIDMAIRLALEAGVILCSYGDPLRVPASNGLSLLRAKAALGGPGSSGGEIRMVYSCADALAIVERYRIALPPAARALLESGAGESVKPADPRLARAQTRIVTAPRRYGRHSQNNFSGERANDPTQG
jgi:hydrogenase expression/formation protein HypD